MRRIMMFAAAALALAGCGKSGPEDKAAMPTGVPPMAGVGAPTLPADLPAFAAPMPGAKLQTAMKTPNGGMLAFYVDAKPTDVVAFYDKQAAAAGIRKIIQSPGNDHGGTGAVYSADPPGNVGSAGMNVSVGPEDGKTRVDVMYKGGVAKP